MKNVTLSILTDAELSLLRRLIDESEHIVICCHHHPDGDAIGSSLALSDYLQSNGRPQGYAPTLPSGGRPQGYAHILPSGGRGNDGTPLQKDVRVCIPDMFPDFLQRLPGSERVIRYDKSPAAVAQAFAEAQLVFCLDFNRAERVAGMSDILLSSRAAKVMIDHHPEPALETVLTISHPEMSSTCELLFRVLWQLGAFDVLSRFATTAIYCGMMTDTGAFTYNSNTPEIYLIISLLLSKGIDKDKIYRNIYHNYSEWRLRLMGYVLYQKLNVIADKHAAYFTLTRKDMQRFHFVRGDAEGLVNVPLQIKGLRLSISLREDTEQDNLIWVSLRSVDDCSCTQLAEKYFNGGGHLNASGGRLYCSMQEAEEVVRQAIDAL